MVSLRTKRLVIATPDEKNIEDVFSLMSTRCVAERAGFKRLEDVSETEGKVRWAMRTNNMFIISTTSDNEQVGIIFLTPKEVSLPKGTLVDYEIGYFVKTSSQGNGYMTEALEGMKEYLFQERKADRLTIYLEPDNAPSRKVALANGFRFSHAEKDAGVKDDGTVVDLEFYVSYREELNADAESISNNYLNGRKWINDGGILYPIPGSASLLATPGNGVFRLFKEERSNRIGLEKISESFSFNFKIYGTEGKSISDHIIDTWESDVFKTSGKNLGVIFNGIKGTGKTIAAKQLCNRLGLPTIVISYPMDGLVEFIQSLNFEASILIDEAEKTFDDEPEMLLKMIDGVYNTKRKLYVLTTNDLNLDDNLLGRPGRIRYIKQFQNLNLDIVKEVMDDTLKDKGLAEELLLFVSKLEISTIDILKSVIEECNITGRVPDMDIFNVPSLKYNIRLLQFEDLDIEQFENLRTFIIENNTDGKPINKWLSERMADDEENTWGRIIERKFNCEIRPSLINSQYNVIRRFGKVGYKKVLTTPDEYGFFQCESYSDRDLYCQVGCMEGPSLY